MSYLYTFYEQKKQVVVVLYKFMLINFTLFTLKVSELFACVNKRSYGGLNNGSYYWYESNNANY